MCEPDYTPKIGNCWNWINTTEELCISENIQIERACFCTMKKRVINIVCLSTLFLSVRHDSYQFACSSIGEFTHMSVGRQYYWKINQRSLDRTTPKLKLNCTACRQYSTLIPILQLAITTIPQERKIANKPKEMQYIIRYYGFISILLLSI